MVMDPHDSNAWEERMRRATARVPPAVRDRLPPLEGLRVLLLEGNPATGEELAAAGALVTLTREHPREAGELPVVQADPAQLPSELLRGRFDLVYLEPGSLPAQLEEALTGVFQALRPLGWLVVFERHPADGSRSDYFDGWTVGHVVTAVSRAGFAVKRLEEYPGQRDPRVPGSFLLRAEKPQ
jgi:hypothetical protein